LDLDLLLYDQLVFDDAGLTIPHPRMAWRRFVLEPAAEVAPEMLHPTTGWTISRLVEHLDTAALYVAISGPAGAGKTRLAKRLARETEARLIAASVDEARSVKEYRDSPGGSLARELEFLNQRARLLASNAPEWSDRQRLAVSDFWYDQLLAYADVRLPAESRCTFRRQWRDVRKLVVEPKLTVMLDAPIGRVDGRRRETSRKDRLDDGRLRQALLALATTPGHGPVLRAENTELKEVVSEVLAAIDATRPQTVLS
jgi:thymidylate kinase